jgi:hypothetical protein
VRSTRRQHLPDAVVSAGVAAPLGNQHALENICTLNRGKGSHGLLSIVDWACREISDAVIDHLSVV